MANLKLKESTHRKLKAVAGLMSVDVQKLVNNVLVEYLEKVDMVKLAKCFETEFIKKEVKPISSNTDTKVSQRKPRKEYTCFICNVKRAGKAKFYHEISGLLEEFCSEKHMLERQEMLGISGETDETLPEEGEELL